MLVVAIGSQHRDRRHVFRVRAEESRSGLVSPAKSLMTPACSAGRRVGAVAHMEHLGVFCKVSDLFRKQQALPSNLRAGRTS